MVGTTTTIHKSDERTRDERNRGARKSVGIIMEKETNKSTNQLNNKKTSTNPLKLNENNEREKKKTLLHISIQTF